jgi:ribosomal protein S18 acetylase RimI-like enzyme
MFKIRLAKSEDLSQIEKLYKAVAAKGDGIAREENEITGEYVKDFMSCAKERGIEIVAEQEGIILAEIHCYRPHPKVFHHILSDLTIAVHPAHQQKGIGRLIFRELLGKVAEMADIKRVELIVRESNKKAINFYKSLGFQVEGRMENRINVSGSFEADIPMAYLK